ncbi:MAG: hypothetical protein RIG84_11345 [Roseovarius sp.]
MLLPVFLGLAACSAQVPDSAAGVGFNDYATYEKQQAAANVPAAQPVSQQPLSATSAPMETTPLASTPLATASANTTPQDDSAALAADTQAALAASRLNSGEVPLEASPNNPPPQTVTTPTGISEENDFNAVGEVRSIESDAALLAQNRAQYQVVQPTSLPARVDAGPNIVEYALSTKHPVGTKVWNRIGIAKQSRYERNCAQYASPDKAQADFLEKGGPNRDRLGLDPDGDGYACGWNPAPFRRAVQG